VENAHHAVVTNSNQPRAIRTPCHLRRGEMTFRRQSSFWRDSVMRSKRVEGVAESRFAFCWS
jgi:hypothetical protein